MFTAITYQDWVNTSVSREKMIQNVISEYKVSQAFTSALTAQRYYDAENVAVSQKTILEADVIKVRDENGLQHRQVTNKEIAGNRVFSNFFYRFVNQQVSFLLGSGVTLDDEKTKAKLGAAFDTTLSKLGKKALVHGVSWGYWNVDHIEIIPACSDALSGSVALLDEVSGSPRVLIQFWQLSTSRPMYARLFEQDGVTLYSINENAVREVEAKRAYRVTVARDGRGEQIVGQDNYSTLPIIPLYANDRKHTELSNAIKSKIDLYDRIASDFGDNLDRANDIYWVLNNFGGNTDDVLLMLKQIRELKAIANISDGTGGGSTAEPKTFEVPYNARQTAMAILERQLYSDYMALSMDELTGGSLTNVAIKAAMLNLNLKADDFEWHVFEFVQSVLRLIGVETERIAFKRTSLINDSEIIENIYRMREDIDHETALKLNPYIEQDDIQPIIDKIEQQRAMMQAQFQPTETEETEDEQDEEK